MRRCCVSPAVLAPSHSERVRWASALAALAFATTVAHAHYASNRQGVVVDGVDGQAGVLTQAWAGLRYFVAPTNSGTADGTSWPTAYTDIQAALDLATNGDVIYLKGGLFAITRQLSWTNSGVTILGSYEGTNASEPGAFSAAAWPTVLARPAGSAFTNRILFVGGVAGGALSRVTLSNGWLNGSATGACLCVSGSSDLLLSSVTVAGGNVQPTAVGPSRGGGVFILNSTNVTLAGCTIAGNRGTASGSDWIYGCGVCAIRSTLTLTNCVIRDNYLLSGNKGCYGGGLYTSGGRATVVDTVVLGNFATAGGPRYTAGSGVYVDGGTNVFRNCLIAANDNYWHGSSPTWGVFRGDGVYHNGGLSTFANCTIIRNNGEGIYFASGSVMVTNCILWDNRADLAGFPTNSQGVLPGVWHCAVEDGDNAGTNGCTDRNPLFERGLYLSTNSPCIDAGGMTAADAGLAGCTTRADGAPDAGPVDLGYHFTSGILGTAAADLYVSPAGADANAGTDPDGSVRSITRALALATHGSRIHIAAGLYTNGIESFPLTINDTFGLELLATSSAATVISPAGTGQSAFSLRGAGYVRIEGLTVTGGNGIGPGMAAAIANSRLTIASCVFSNNFIFHAYGKGAGIYMRDTILTLTNCSLVRNRINTSGYLPSIWQGLGGGLAAEGGELTLVDSQIASNTAWAGTQGPASVAAGAGVYLAGNYGGVCHVISNCVFVGNSLACLNNSQGGGLYIAATAIVRNCVLAGNWITNGSQLGGGVLADAGSATLINCTVAGNAPDGVRQSGTSGVLAVRSSILWNNGDDLASSQMSAALSNTWYCDIQDGDNAGTNGCIAADPLFADPACDWHELSRGGRWAPGDGWVKDVRTSPCIDAGDPGADYSPEPAPNGRRVNMGAYGNTAQASKTPDSKRISITIR